MPFDGAGHAGGEQRLLPVIRQVPQRLKGFTVVVQFKPVQRQDGAVELQHALAARRVGEALVVAANRGPVGGFDNRDVQRVRAIAGPEHRPGHLEHAQVEGGGEVLRQVRLDQRGADGAKVVAQPDPDPGALARLGCGIRHRVRTRQRRRLYALRVMRTPGMRLAVCGIAGFAAGPVHVGGLAVRGIGEVLGTHQPLDRVQRAVVGDGDDGAGHLPILAPKHGPGGDRTLDLLQAGLDALEFGLRLLGPGIVLHLSEFIAPDGQLLDFLCFVRGGLAGFRADAREPRGVAPLDLDPGLGPGPFRTQFLGGGLEPIESQLAQQGRIVEPDAPLVLLGEEVPGERAAGGLVGCGADELRDRRGRGYAALGHEPADLPHARAVVLGLEFLPHGELQLRIGCDAKRLKALQAHLPRPVGLQQFRRGVAEPQPLFDRALGNAEPRGDFRDGAAVGCDARKRLDLIGRVHGRAHGVFHERQLGGVVSVGDDVAGNGMIGRDSALVGQRLERRQAPPAGDDLVAGLVFGIGGVGTDQEIFQQPVGGDGRLELLERRALGRRLPHVLGRGHERGKGNATDRAFGSGHGGSSEMPRRGARMKRNGGEGRLRPTPGSPGTAARPEPSRARDGSAARAAEQFVRTISSLSRRG